MLNKCEYCNKRYIASQKVKHLKECFKYKNHKRLLARKELNEKILKQQIEDNNPQLEIKEIDSLFEGGIIIAEEVEITMKDKDKNKHTEKKKEYLEKETKKSKSINPKGKKK